LRELFPGTALPDFLKESRREYEPFPTSKVSRISICVPSYVATLDLLLNFKSHIAGISRISTEYQWVILEKVP